MAGAAKVRMKYPENFFPHVSFRGRYFTGIHDDLQIRVLFIQSGESPLIFISLELGDVSDEWITPLSREFGVPESHIFITATHTHAAPHVSGTWPEDVGDVAESLALNQCCWEQMLAAVYAARQAVSPAVMSIANEICHVNVNRDFEYHGANGEITAPYIHAPNPGGISDKTVQILRFEHLNGVPIAYLVNYAVHSNVTFYQSWDRQNGMLISGDIAGCAMRYIEEHEEHDVVAMFTLGAAADQMPRYIANHRVFDKYGNAGWNYVGQEGAFVLMEAQGSDLGRIVSRRQQFTRVQHPEMIKTAMTVIHAAEKVKENGTPPQTLSKDSGTVGMMQQYYEKSSDSSPYQVCGELEMPLYLLSIGSVLLVGLPAEIVTSIGMDIKQMILKECDRDVIVVTQCNGSYSYITDEDGYEKRTFEAMASHFMPGAAQIIVEGVQRLIKEIGI